MLRPANRFYWIVPVAVWTGLVLLSLFLSLRHTQQNAEENARQQGRDIFNMTVAMRQWNSEVGGLYAPLTNRVPANPYLEVPERDPVTTSGKVLTLVNPAYMTRQMSGVIEQESGIRIRITSLRPTNPTNAAEPWEADALHAFERKQEAERSELVNAGDSAQIRYIAPLLVRKECLDCHQTQQYAIGDVRGAISVSIPAEQFVGALQADRREHVSTHAVVWLLVTAMLTFALRQYRHQWNALQGLAGSLESRVAERTAALTAESDAHRAAENAARASEQRFLDLVNTTDGIVWEADANTFVFTFVSHRAETLLGYPVDDWQKPGFWVEHLHPDDRDWAPAFCASCTGRLEPHRFEYRFLTANGSTVWLEDIVTVVSEGGKPTLLRGLMVDITRRKEAESEVRNLTQRLTLATHAAHIGIWEYEPESGRVVWDPTMYEIFGLSSEQFQGRFEDIAPHIHADDLPHLEALTQESLSQGSDFVTTFRILRHGHEIRYIDAHAVVVPANNSHPARMIGVNRDITERKRNEQELVRLATTDPLTGSFNRGYLQRAIDQEVNRARRYGDPLSLIMYDLDKFKQVNDTWGHDVGDHVLAHTTGVVRDTIRRTDVLARWGGEEFMVLCPRTTAADAAVLAERLLEALRAHPAEVAGVVTASIGVVTLREGEDTNTLLKRVDDLLYSAKTTGRDRACTDGPCA